MASRQLNKKQLGGPILPILVDGEPAWSFVLASMRNGMRHGTMPDIRLVVLSACRHPAYGRWSVRQGSNTMAEFVCDDGGLSWLVMACEAAPERPERPELS